MLQHKQETQEAAIDTLRNQADQQRHVQQENADLQAQVQALLRKVGTSCFNFPPIGMGIDH